MNNIVKVTVFLVNWDDFAAFNEVYSRFMQGHQPARTTVEVSRIAQGAPLPALGEDKVCDYCPARGLCRRDFRATPQQPANQAANA